MDEFFYLIIFAIAIFLLLKNTLTTFLQRNNSIKTIKSKIAARKIPDEAYFEMAAAEVARGTIRKGLWAKALSEALGDERKAGAIYIKLRVHAMREEAATAIFNAAEGKSFSRSPGANQRPAYPEKRVLACPECKKRLRVDSGKHLDITCPHCSTVFRAHT
jgi:Zn finger protein HypA/HybF involved in hydrogenase expression